MKNECLPVFLPVSLDSPSIIIMGFLIDCVYALTLAIIRIYKIVELGGIKLISGPLRRKIVSELEKIGIMHHLPGELNVGISEEDEKRILKLSGYKSICQLKIKDNSFFNRLANRGMLGLAEEYMNENWEIIGTDEDLTKYITRLLENNKLEKYLHPINRFIHYMELQAFNLQTTGKAFEVAEKHYDLGNELFESFLDPWMQYTCGYWAKADNLNDAQVAKMDLIARKLDLKPGMRVLDVGSGWGGLSKYLAKNYGVECVGITVGSEGVKYAKKQGKGLPVEFRVQDYREVDEKFDRIVSVGMFEHVGVKNYHTYFKVLHKCLKDDGIFLLHTVGRNHKNIPRSDPYVHKYIFPNGGVPNTKDITEMTDGLFIIEDWHNFSSDYFNTLVSWRENFQRNWPTISHKYGKRFYRMWTLYLCVAAALFKARRLQLWQIVLSKNGLKREYRAAR